MKTIITLNESSVLQYTKLHGNYTELAYNIYAVSKGLFSVKKKEKKVLPFIQHHPAD